MSIPALQVLETTRRLRLTRPGRLLPWLGPALRGLAAARFKARVCRFPPAIQQTERRYCKGCPHIAECPYGRTVEPDPPAHVHVPSGQEDAARPLIIAPAYPAPRHAVPGTQLPLCVTFVGRTAAAHAEDFWAALAQAGRTSGLGPDGVTFAVELDSGSPAATWHDVVLPLDVSAESGEMASVKVELTGPLILRSGGPEGRRLVTAPTFADLLRASLRTIGPLCRLYGRPLPDEVFRPLKDLSADVPTRSASFEEYEQPKWSNRSEQHGRVRGVLGWGTYGPLPRVLVSWLTWGGRLHVGTHRVAGAGGWQTWCAEG
jgi:hypothetical protein